MPVRVFKDLEFQDWAAEYGVNDNRLCTAASEIEAGLIDARLGGFLIKKRVAAEGRGKRGGYRTILGYREGSRLIFVHGEERERKHHTEREGSASQIV